MKNLDAFNDIAPYYDQLAGFVFGKSIQQSQQYFINEVHPGSRVLLLGGGTGNLLKALLESIPGCEVWYIEASSEMLRLAQLKVQSPMVHFIHGTHESIPAGVLFDVVIAPFFFDLFHQDELPGVLQRIRLHTVRSTLWIITDFVSNTLWKRIIINIMYLFFRITCNLKSKALPSWEMALKNCGMAEARSNSFYCSFIKAAIYRGKP